MSGTNFWCCCYLSDAGLPEGRQRMVRELDRLQSIGVKNIRLLAGSETRRWPAPSPAASPARRTIMMSPARRIGFCLAEMAKRDMRGILFLSNYWQWSGGFAQYVRWITGENIPDPDRPVIARGDWSGFMKFSARLYTTPAANELYRGYVTKIIQRRNTINGRIYRDDPAVMTWELANEPRPGVDEPNNSDSRLCPMGGCNRAIHP
jgi:mannan endo-1,4-beta-mannosidase